MKTLDALYHEIEADPSLQEELAQAVERGETARFLSAHGCQASPEEAAAYIGRQRPSGALADEELDNVAGGGLCDKSRDTQDEQEVDAISGASPSISKGSTPVKVEKLPGGGFRFVKRWEL